MTADGRGIPLRLLPWAGVEGKPCYVSGDGSGAVSRAADTVEAIQLGMSGDLLSHAAELLADRRSTPGEIRFLANCLTDSLRDVRRVAESRGVRLSALAAADAGHDPHDSREPDNNR